MENIAEDGRVWIVEHKWRVAQLDTAQYGMLLARYNDSDRHSIPPALFLSSLGASCRAQCMPDLEQIVHLVP